MQVLLTTVLPAAKLLTFLQLCMAVCVYVCLYICGWAAELLLSIQLLQLLTLIRSGVTRSTLDSQRTPAHAPTRLSEINF